MAFLPKRALPRMGLLGWLSLWLVMLPLFHVHPAVAHHHGDTRDLHVHAAIAHTVFSADVPEEHHISFSSVESPSQNEDHGFSAPEANHEEINFSLLPLSPDRKAGKAAGNLVACNFVGREPVNLARSYISAIPLASNSSSLLLTGLSPRAPPFSSI